jgi:hypothetical protein
MYMLFTVPKWVVFQELHSQGVIDEEAVKKHEFLSVVGMVC